MKAPAALAFGPKGRQLFGLYHAPEASVARGIGAVLCNPLGHEAMSTHRTYRHLAERLTAAGVHVLRFDYHGTGDSSGNADEPHRVRTWLGDIGTAIDELRALSGVKIIDLVGVRFGATLAARVAEERRDVRSLVLWAPCTSGRSYVRELRAFRRIKGQPQGAESPPPSGNGVDEEIAGYWYADATLRDLAAIDLSKTTTKIAERAYILMRDDLPSGEARLAKALRAAGVDAVAREAPGYADMMRDPQDSIVPFEALDAIVDFIRASRDEHVPVASPRRASPRPLVASARSIPATVREEPIQFGDDGRLFGILTEPADGVVDPRRPAVLFLNAGANHRVGPNRMYVSLARDLAALGYVTFRFDVAGIGDSIGTSYDERRLYSTDSVRDVAHAVALMSKVRGIESTVLVGVCSGAYLAFHTGLIEPRVAGQILINPQTFDWNVDGTLELTQRKSFKSTRYYLRAFTRREVWAQAMRGNIDARSVAGVLRERLAHRVGEGMQELFARLRGELLPPTDVARAFGTMSDRGLESLLVFSSNDGGLDMIERHLGRGARKLRRKNIRMEIVEDADHTFTLVRWQRELTSIITSFVTRAFPSTTVRSETVRRDSHVNHA